MTITLTLPAVGDAARRQRAIEATARRLAQAIEAGTRAILADPSTDVGRLVAAAAARPEVRRLQADAEAAVVEHLRGIAVNLARSRLDLLGGGLAHLSPAQRQSAQALLFPFTGLDGSSQARPVRRLSPGGVRAPQVPGARVGREPRAARAPRRPRPARRPRRPRSPRVARAPRPPRPRRPERDPLQRNRHYCQAPQRHFKATGELGCNWTGPDMAAAAKAQGDEIRESPGCAACGGHGCRGPLAPLGNFVAQAIFGPPEVGRAEREITRRQLEARRRGRRPRLVARVEERAAGAPPPPAEPAPAPFCAEVNCIVAGIGGTRCFATAAERDAWHDREVARCQAATPGYFRGGPR